MIKLFLCTKIIRSLTSEIKTITLGINEQLDGITQLGFASILYQKSNQMTSLFDNHNLIGYYRNNKHQMIRKN